MIWVIKIRFFVFVFVHNLHVSREDLAGRPRRLLRSSEAFQGLDGTSCQSVTGGCGDEWGDGVTDRVRDVWEGLSSSRRPLRRTSTTTRVKSGLTIEPRGTSKVLSAGRRHTCEGRAGDSVTRDAQGSAEYVWRTRVRRGLTIDPRGTRKVLLSTCGRHV